MAELTQQEQDFFNSGGDISRLELNAPPNEPAIVPPIDLAGLGNSDPQPAVPAPPPVAAAVPTPTPDVVPTTPQPDQTEFLRNQLAQAQQHAADLRAQLAASQQPKAPEVPIPDPVADPLGNMLHQLDAVNKRTADLQATLDAQQNQSAQLNAFQNFQRQVTQLRDQFAAANPDFPTAYDHLRNTRMADLRALGYPEQDVTRQIFQEEIAVSQAALQRGQNPAEAVYEMAKRHGYQAKPVAPATPASTGQKLDAIKAGLATSTANLPRTPVNEELTAESLREASDADLNRLVTDPAAWARIAGTNNHPI